MAKYKEKHSEVKLLLIGEEPDENMFEKLAQELGLIENVCFCGNRDDVNRLLMAMDIMIFPSFTEGFPL